MDRLARAWESDLVCCPDELQILMTLLLHID